MEYEVSEDFIGFLVEQTLNGVSEDVDKKRQVYSQLEQHQEKSKPIAKGFIRGLKIFCDEFHISYAEGSYRKDVQCFNLRVNEQEMDIPSTWAKFPENFDKRARGYLFTMEQNDPSLFPQIMSKLLTLKIKKIHSFHERDKCIFIFLNEFHLRRFKQYFSSIFTEETKENEIKKAG